MFDPGYRDDNPVCLTTGWSRVQCYADLEIVPAFIDDAIERAAFNLKPFDSRLGLSFGDPKLWLHVVAPSTLRELYGLAVEEWNGPRVLGLCFPNARLALVSMPRAWLIAHEVGHYLAYWRLKVPADAPESEMWARRAAAGLE